MKGSAHVLLQTLCTFGALLDGSVLLYVGWTMLVPPALGLAVDHRVLRGRLPILAGLGLVVGGLAPLVALGTRSWPELRSLVYLVIWTVVEAVVQLWNAVRVQPEAATSWMRMNLSPIFPPLLSCISFHYITFYYILHYFILFLDIEYRVFFKYVFVFGACRACWAVRVSGFVGWV